MATEFCPTDQVVQKSAVDYARSGVAASAGCRDKLASGRTAGQSLPGAYFGQHGRAYDPVDPNDPNATDPSVPVDRMYRWIRGSRIPTRSSRIPIRMRRRNRI